jgi:glycosyltransferase involved in cell wall biosynthesis
MDSRFGIVIATRPRCRYLPKVIAQVRSQTFAAWQCVLVADGPSPRARDLFARHTAGDDRFQYAETPRRSHDWGLTPRCLGLEVLTQMNQPPERVVFWDDDDAYEEGAMQTVAGAVERHPGADLLLVPIHAFGAQIPPPGLSVEQAAPGEICTANFVIRLELARALYPADPQARERGTDFRFFQRVQAAGCYRIAQADVPPIGCYDGLRLLAKLRWRLGIPKLGLTRFAWYRALKFALRW